MEALIIVAFGLLGLAVGSFLNVCIDRLPRDESILNSAKMGLRRKSPVILAFVLIATICFVPVAHADPPYYRDYDTFKEAFMSLVHASPELITYETIGKTVENQDIIMFKIGNPDGGKVLFDGAMHGTENMGGELLYFYAKWLLTSNDPLANRILARDYTLLIPVLNIEGMQRYERKNANGVDLNRNFATNWENGGSTNPDSDT